VEGKYIPCRVTGAESIENIDNKLFFDLSGHSTFILVVQCQLLIFIYICKNAGDKWTHTNTHTYLLT